ncbi:MAG TPA: fatty acid desaturase [Novimethylophilus sp.]|jgi:stearoyl-CoA desaturase (delta-9 desaturase)|uniref:DesA family fatty acid desaturase n=1 Tax=Novimethylophilus sp. TaxID=2137426 RepID=UPI002F3ECA46
MLGYFDLPWWGYALAALALTHITIVSVTIFLHRHQSHRALTLHPITSHFFRFWLWLTTGIVTREWVSIHRKHHVKCETPEDPHSPQVFGIREILLKGAEYYRAEAKNTETLESYGHGTPDDWIERKLYSGYPSLGIGLMMVIDLIAFGPIGLTIWAVQMIWIPLFAAGVVNGIGHFWGYRSFVTNDASRNIMPWGVLIGGEELHNNHHAFSASAKLSSRWWELDIGWMYIRLLAVLKLATVRRIAPRMRFTPAKSHCDLTTLQAIVIHRYEVQAKFAKSLLRTAVEEIRSLRRSQATPELRKAGARSAIKLWLQKGMGTLAGKEHAALSQALHSSKILQTIDSMRQELVAFGARSTVSREQLVQQLEDWCRRAEESGILALQQFSRQLRCYG